jgi:polyhydroxyalkanoate synthesis regulator protein
MSVKNHQSLIEQREKVREDMRKALAENTMAKYHKLNCQLQKLNGKIRKDGK